MPLRNLLIIATAAVISLACFEKAERNRYATTLTEAIHLINEHYVEEVDPRRLFEDAMAGMMRSLDEYSSFIGPSSYQQVQETLDQQFGGIGIVVEGPPRTERLTVTSPLVGTPAFKAGIMAGDVILEIDGNSTEGMQLEEAVALMRGRQGTAVRLVVQHLGSEESVEMTIRRAVIPIDSVLGDVRREDGSWQYWLESDSRIGYIRLTTFGDRTIAELTEALKFEERPTEALILDLRNNAGGLLESAVRTCDLFIDQGLIVSTRGRGDRIKSEHYATSNLLVDPDLPLVVLVDRFSASASEIVAACLQDHGRAIVVGERTWGKGTVQNIINLEGGQSALKLTTASYWRPNGRNIHRFGDADEDEDWGVTPNDGFLVELDDEIYEIVLRQRRARDLNLPAEQLVRTQDESEDASAARSDDEGRRQQNDTGGWANDEPVETVDEPQDDLSHHDIAQVEDPQLERAVEYLLEIIGAGSDSE